jgi:hypothetical protein
MMLIGRWRDAGVISLERGSSAHGNECRFLPHACVDQQGEEGWMFMDSGSLAGLVAGVWHDASEQTVNEN